MRRVTRSNDVKGKEGVPMADDRMEDQHEAQKRRNHLALLETARARRYITLWEAAAAASHSPVDLDEVGEILTEAGIQLDDSEEQSTNWVREAEPDDEELDEAIEDEADQLPSRFFQPGEYAPDTPAAIYLRDISQVPLLTAEEEIELARALERGEQAKRALALGGVKPEKVEELEAEVREGEAARKRLTESNLRL